MMITDLYGQEIEAENLQLAIMQVDDFRHYELQVFEHLAYNRKMKNYWEHFYQQLLLLDHGEQNRNFNALI